MAHALRRVSLSTARPVDAQFAFVSHNPGSTDVQLYCHVFKARHARAVRTLNRYGYVNQGVIFIDLFYSLWDFSWFDVYHDSES